MLRVLPVCCAVVLSSVPASWASQQESVLERAALYRPYLTTQAVRFWGNNPPLPLFAGQIHQESGWDPAAQSAYACGLTQFTPETAKWIADTYKVDVGSGRCTDPRWAIRAMLRYNKHLSEAILLTRTPCDNAKFFLSAYNGGLGWVQRDRAKAHSLGLDPSTYKTVEPINAGRALPFFEENRDYPRKIVQHQRRYSDWGGVLTCKEEMNGTVRSESVVPRPRSDDPWRCAGIDRLICKLAALRHGP